MLTQASITDVIVPVEDLATCRRFYEKGLGLRAVQQGDQFVTFQCGPVRLSLERIAATRPQSIGMHRDRSVNVTFLADDVRRLRQPLAERGVDFVEFFQYEVGEIADLYDPEGHWISIYAPSAQALTWPGSDKLRSLQRATADATEADEASGAAAEASPGLGRSGLIYLFVFVGDADEALGFYRDRFGLQVVDSRPCRRGSTAHDKGVVKYDAGPVLFTTHHIHGCQPDADAASVESAEVERLDRAIAPVFKVAGLDAVAASLAKDGVQVSEEPVRCSDLSSLARVDDPFGHRLYLRSSAAPLSGGPTPAADLLPARG